MVTETREPVKYPTTQSGIWQGAFPGLSLQVGEETRRQMLQSSFYQVEEQHSSRHATLLGS